MRLLIIGKLDNRRVTGFVAEMAARGLPPPLLIDHLELVARPGRLLELEDAPMLVRLEAAGEDPELERALLELGHAALEAGELAPDPAYASCERVAPEALRRRAHRHGQLLAPRQHHAGFLAYLATLEAIFARRPRWRVLNPPADLRVLFDKRRSAARYAALGVPVPEALSSASGPGAPADPEQLRAAMVARGWPAVFVKLSCASSASGLALYRHLPMRPPGQRDYLLTTLAETPEGRFNTLRPRELLAREAIDGVLGWILDEGARVERAVPKPRVAGQSFDLRVLVIAGEPAFVVARQSRHPITNLHLGGRRGELESIRARVDPGSWDAALASCARVARAHACLHLGVDLCFERDLVHHRVLEANAFGDLLPGLRRAGKSVYAWELEAMAALWERGPSPP